MTPDELLRLDNQLCFALYAASRAVVQAYQPLLAPLGVTYPQYLVLLVLWEHDGLSVSQIGERLRLDSGTLTPLLKRLEAQGLVRRERSGRDERVVEVHLTSKGQKLKQRAASIPHDLACKMGISVRDLVALRTELVALTERITAEAPPEASPPRKGA